MDEALDQAMRAFWRHGYRSTSVRHLCEAMDLQTGSFYAAFGSKDDLFVQVLARYLEAVSPGPPGPEALGAYLTRVVADRDPTGCLLVASAMERDALPGEAQRLVDRGMSGLRVFLAASLAEPGDADEVLAMVTGLQVFHRAGVAGDRLGELAKRILSR